MFFDACDGFFTNYNWTEESLVSMSAVGSAEGRHADIYVGVDVFARGKVVGGMLETNEVTSGALNMYVDVAVRPCDECITDGACLL